MVKIFDATDPKQLLAGSRQARQALAQGELIVLPTDTVYGVAADAFTPDAVDALLAAKGRGRQSPPPVLVADINAINALAASVPQSIMRLAEEFWPGPLTIVLEAQPSLNWDLGETAGTVALRIPDHEVTLEILRETGPLAVSSANLTGQPAASSATEAEEMLGESVKVIIDSGETLSNAASTIIDATAVNDEGGLLRILRPGPITIEQLAEVCPELIIALPAKRAPEPVEETVSIEEAVSEAVTASEEAGSEEEVVTEPSVTDPDAQPIQNNDKPENVKDGDK